MRIPEHPELCRALGTGFPRRDRRRLICADCGRGLCPEDPDFRALYDWRGDTLCGECLKEQLSALPAMALAGLLECRVLEP